MSGELDGCGLSPGVIGRIGEVFARHPGVVRVTLYGSRAKGNFRNGSDIDLSITEGAPAPGELPRIERELDDLLLPYKIDLSLFDRIENQELIDHIRRVGIPFYTRSEADS